MRAVLPGVVASPPLLSDSGLRPAADVAAGAF